MSDAEVLADAVQAAADQRRARARQQHFEEYSADGGFAAEAAELEWWRSVFSCRFRARNLPKPGAALGGIRLVLMIDGDRFVEWPG